MTHKSHNLHWNTKLYASSMTFDIYRKIGSGEYIKIAEGITSNFYEDSDISNRGIYFYKIKSIISGVVVAESSEYKFYVPFNLYNDDTGFETNQSPFFVPGYSPDENGHYRALFSSIGDHFIFGINTLGMSELELSFSMRREIASGKTGFRYFKLYYDIGAGDVAFTEETYDIDLISDSFVASIFAIPSECNNLENVIIKIAVSSTTGFDNSNGDPYNEIKEVMIFPEMINPFEYISHDHNCRGMITDPDTKIFWTVFQDRGSSSDELSQYVMGFGETFISKTKISDETDYPEIFVDEYTLIRQGIRAFKIFNQKLFTTMWVAGGHRNRVIDAPLPGSEDLSIKISKCMPPFLDCQDIQNIQQINNGIYVTSNNHRYFNFMYCPDINDISNCEVWQSYSPLEHPPPGMLYFGEFFGKLYGFRRRDHSIIEISPEIKRYTGTAKRLADEGSYKVFEITCAEIDINRSYLNYMIIINGTEYEEHNKCFGIIFQEIDGISGKLIFKCAQWITLQTLPDIDETVPFSLCLPETERIIYDATNLDGIDISLSSYINAFNLTCIKERYLYIITGYPTKPNYFHKFDLSVLDKQEILNDPTQSIEIKNSPLSYVGDYMIPYKNNLYFVLLDSEKILVGKIPVNNPLTFQTIEIPEKYKILKEVMLFNIVEDTIYLPVKETGGDPIFVINISTKDLSYSVVKQIFENKGE